MHAVVITEFGGPEKLQLQEVPDPAPPGPGEVLVQVAASGINRADLLQRQGHYPPPAGASGIPGMECSGTVVAIGPGVTNVEVGADVCALLTAGGYASQVVVPSGQLMAVPAGVSLIHAAALPEVACTVWSNVIDVAKLAWGEVLLVHGGSSGIGTMAIQAAVALRQAKVIVTAGSDAKRAACLGLGAWAALDYHADWVAEVKELAPVDVVLDIIGARYATQNLDVLALGGRIATIGLQGGVTAEVNLGLMLMKRAAWYGTTLRSRPAADKARIVAGTVRDLWPAVTDGRIRPVVDSVLPASEAAAAHQLVADSGHIGKVLLDWSAVA